MQFLKAMQSYVFGLMLGLLGLVGSAHAALDTSVTTAFDAVKADAVTLSGIVVPIVVSVLGLVITIKLIKRFGNKI